MRVVVAMSGGVDSSVAAALLQQQGHEVIGITLHLYDLPRASAGSAARSCCSSNAIRAARRAAATLGIPHYSLDFRKQFEEQVIAGFCTDYGRGRTPNPCLACNQRMKFGLLFERLTAFSADCLATGHYARVQRSADGSWQLLQAQDTARDQSYFLFQLTQERLSRLLLPLGEYTKTEIRRIARELNLPVADRKDSQDICFALPDCREFLKQRHPEFFRAGKILNTAGETIGEHSGIAGLTLGQRKGLGLALGTRNYIVHIDSEQNTIVLGTAEEAYRTVVYAESLNWIA
ncbi:MAG: tRNA 2-thiouridine(34) synthase MnmA, partial [candidate division WOR-3 bacterium]